MNKDSLLGQARSFVEGNSNSLPTNIERIPSLVAENASLLNVLSKQVSAAYEEAKKANKEADEMKSFEDKSIKIFSKDIIKWKSGDIKEITEEHQKISKSIAKALKSNTEATSLLFYFQKKLAETISDMFYLGCFDLAHNEAMVKSLKKQISIMKEAKKGNIKNTNSEEAKLSDIAKEEFINLVKRLQQQRNFLNIQNEHGNEIKNIKNQQTAFITKVNEQTSSALAELEKKNREDSDSLHKEHEAAVSKLQESINKESEQLKMTSDRLEKEQSSFITKVNEQTSSALAELEKKSREDSDSLHKEHEAAVSKLQESINKESEQLKMTSDRLEKEQSSFITKVNEQTSSALKELQETSHVFIEEKSTQFEMMRKQLFIFKIISVLAISVSLIIAFLTLL